jgi:hypothetical protein
MIFVRRGAQHSWRRRDGLVDPRRGASAIHCEVSIFPLKHASSKIRVKEDILEG